MVRVSDNFLLEFKTEKLMNLIFFNTYKLMSYTFKNNTHSLWLIYKINYSFIEFQTFKSNENIFQKLEN